jgi:hypothetical protein
MPITQTPTITDILVDPCASYWIKDAISELVQRDTLDALKDVEILQAIFSERWHKEINSIN